MVVRLLIAIMLVVSGGAYAGVDTTCVNDCMRLNNPKPFCVSECSYSDNTEPLRAKPRAPTPRDPAMYLQAPDQPAPKHQSPKDLAVDPPASNESQAASQCLESCGDQGSTPQFCQRLCAKLAHSKEDKHDAPDGEDR
jgi:hypothetical protein